MRVERGAADPCAVENFPHGDLVEGFGEKQGDESVAESIPRPHGAAVGLADTGWGGVFEHGPGKYPEPPRARAGHCHADAPTFRYMNDNRTGGMMLVAGSAAGIVVMAVHPIAHHGLLSPHQTAMLVLLTRTVHGFALANLPVIFLGALALTRRLTVTNRLPLAALVVYGFALVAITIAGCMNGFVGSDLISKLVPDDPATDMRRLLLEYTFQVNQAFSAVYTVGSCAAIFLWSVAMMRTRRTDVGLGVYGVALGIVVVGALFSGHLPLNVHGFGLVVFAQSVWFIIAGILLMRDQGAQIRQKRAAVSDANVIVW